MKIYELATINVDDAECILDEKRDEAIEQIMDLALGKSYLFSSLERATAAAQEMADEEVSQANEAIEPEDDLFECRPLEFISRNEKRGLWAEQELFTTSYFVIYEHEVEG